MLAFTLGGDCHKCVRNEAEIGPLEVVATLFLACARSAVGLTNTENMLSRG